MPTINFTGKDKVVNYHQKVPFRFLNHITEKSCGASENKIIHGDNLDVLKNLLLEYENQIKCIYIDPPYNTGNEGWIYNDNVNDPQLQKWLGQVVGREGEDFNRHDKWLCMMYPRLRLMQKLLSDDGAIFISIDDNEQANLKMICDEIFGQQNFLAMLTRRCMHTVRNSSKDFNKNADYILVYARSKICITSDKNNRIREQVDKSANYKFNDNDGRGFYKLDPIYARNYARPYTFKFKNGIEWSAPEGSYPRYSVETLAKMEDNNQLNFDGVQPRAKRYLNEVQQGQPPDTFLKPEQVGFNSDGTKLLAEVLGVDKAFNQPKPVQLIEYLISILPNNKEAIILDAFAGSGTTAHAVINLNNTDGGNRKFILIESQNYCDTITAERVRRIGGNFSYYEVGEQLFVDGEINPSVDIEQLKRYIYFTETRQKLKSTDKYFLGVHDDTAYYFYYEPNQNTTLNYDFLMTLKDNAANKVIYASTSNLSEKFLRRYNLTFKKIPRDIKML